MTINDLKYEISAYGLQGVGRHFLCKIGVLHKKEYINMRNNYILNLQGKDLERELKIMYKEKSGEELDLTNPKNFNEKMYWLKAYDCTEMKTRLADKYLVKEWIKEQIGEKYLIKTLGVYDSFDEIDFSILPKQFVIKPNHSSGKILIIKDKDSINLQKTKYLTEEWLKETWGIGSLETHYFTIKKKLIVEEYMEELSGELYNYNIHCFNGEPELIWVRGQRTADKDNPDEHIEKADMYDKEWNFIPCRNVYDNLDARVNKPDKLDEMLEIARKLAKDFLYVRVDLYDIDGEIKFGEMTFSNWGGYSTWEPKEMNDRLGDMLKLPIKN